MSSLIGSGQSLDKPDPGPLSDFDRRVADSLNSPYVQMVMLKEFKDYLVQFLSLNQPMIPAGQIFGLNNVLPSVIDIDVFPTSANHTNWNAIDGDSAVYSNQAYGAVKQSTGAQDAEITWTVLLTRGTWTVEILHFTRNDGGIYSVQVDGIEKGTIDGYSAAPGGNVRSSVAGIEVPATSLTQLKLKMATKNASSSSYFGRVGHIQLRRTDNL